MLAPLAAWVVVRPELSLQLVPPLLLGLAVLFWTAGFDLIYATQDADYDKKKGLYSIPGRYGIKAAFRLSLLCHIMAVILWSIIPLFYEPFTPTNGISIYGIGVGLVAIVLAVEHYLVYPRRNRPVDLQRINVAFFHLNVLVSLGLATVGILDLVIPELYHDLCCLSLFKGFR